jgi:regulator of RNase E activity RraA
MNVLWRSEDELLERARRALFTAVVGDVMDKLGFQHQFFPPQVQPLERSMRLVGRAMTVLEADISGGGEPESQKVTGAKPFGLMLEALDSLQCNEVYVATGGSLRYALWGELMSTRARKCGAVGAVMNGYSRDTSGILRMGFATFSRGSYAQDQAPRGTVVDFRSAIQADDVRVEPGDLIFGDMDGVCVVPRRAEEEVLAGAFEKIRGEYVVRKSLEAGMSAKDAFEQYGIL